MNFKSKIFTISRHFFLAAVKIKHKQTSKNLKKLENTGKTPFIMLFLIQMASSKSQLIWLVVAGGSQFLGENFKKLIIYTVIVKIPRQTALIAKNRRFFTLI